METTLSQVWEIMVIFDFENHLNLATDKYDFIQNNKMSLLLESKKWSFIK